MNSILRIIGNFFIIALLVLFFRNVGWLEFIAPAQLSQNPTFNHLLIGGVIGLQMLVIGEILEFVYWIFKTATMGIGKLLYPVFFVVIGYLKIIIPTFYLNDWYQPTYAFIPVLLMSLGIGLIRLPRPSDDKKKK